MEIHTSITGSGNKTIRDLMQFSTFTTNFRQVLCDLSENATWLTQWQYTARQAWKGR